MVMVEVEDSAEMALSKTVLTSNEKGDPLSSFRFRFGDASSSCLLCLMYEVACGKFVIPLRGTAVVVVIGFVDSTSRSMMLAGIEPLKARLTSTWRSMQKNALQLAGLIS